MRKRTSFYKLRTASGWFLGYRDTWTRDEAKARPFPSRRAAWAAKADRVPY